MTDFSQFDGPNKRALRCQDCGEQIGVQFGDEIQLPPGMVVVQCYSCAAVGEAEKILADTGGDTDA